MNSDDLEMFEHKNPVPVDDPESDGYLTTDKSGKLVSWIQDVDGKFWIYPKSQYGIQLQKKWDIASKLNRHYGRLLGVYLIVAVLIFAMIGIVIQYIYGFVKTIPNADPFLSFVVVGILSIFFGILGFILNIIGLIIRYIYGGNRIYIEYPMISAFTSVVFRM